MLQIVALLAVSWFLTWLIEKRGLRVLGLWPGRYSFTYAGILFIVSALLAASAFLLRMYIAQEAYAPAQTLTAQSVLLETWYQFRTVLTEELLCRGALLYILIKRIGQVKAIVISSGLFAILHWINAGVWGNPGMMFLVFAFTFTMGLLLAYAYARTFSLLIPFAIHFGWNLVQNYIFPGTSTGNHIFILVEPPPVVTISYVAFYAMYLLPKIAVLVVDYMIVKRHRQVVMP